MSNKVPKIRFKGFTDDWEKYELGKIGDTYTGLSGKTKEDFGYGKGKYVTYMNVFANPVASLEQLDKIEIDKNQTEVTKGDVFFTTSSETPDEVGLSSVWTYDKRDVYLNSFCFGYRPKFEIDSYYLAFLLRSSSIRKEITFLAQGISRYNISKTKVMEINIPIASKKEQIKIGEYFKTIDNLINFHQNKYNKLINIKKSMLEKMFPKEGEDTPKIRFKGFIEPWQKCKIEDICSISTGKSNTQDKVSNGKYPFYVRSPIIERSNRYLYDEEAVLTVGDGVGTGKVFHYVNGKYDLHQRVYRMYEFDTKIMAKYFYYIFSKDFNDRVMSMTAKTSVDSVRYEMISKMEIKYPSKEEQELICNMLDNLDNLINQNEQKLEKLKNIKKSLLENMFV